MSPETKEIIDDAAKTILRCRNDREVIGEVLEIVYRLGYLNGGIAKTEAALEKIKEAA